MLQRRYPHARQRLAVVLALTVAIALIAAVLFIALGPRSNTGAPETASPVASSLVTPTAIGHDNDREPSKIPSSSRVTLASRSSSGTPEPRPDRSS